MQSYIHFTLEERICLCGLLRQGLSLNAISKIMKRSVSTLSREIKRNGGDRQAYNPFAAQEGYKQRRERSRRVPRLLPDSDLKRRIVRYLLYDNWSPEIISAMERRHHNSIK